MEKVTYTYNVPLVGDVQIEMYSVGNLEHKLVTSFTVAQNEQTYDIKSLVPESWVLHIHPKYWQTVGNRRAVKIGYPKNLKNITAALHEIGHARDIAFASSREQDKKAYRRWWWHEDPFGLSVDELSGILTEECDAWAFAVQELQGLQLSNEAMNQVYRHITAPGEVQSYLRYMTKHLLPAIAQSAQRNPQEINEMLITQYRIWEKNMKEQCGVEK